MADTIFQAKTSLVDGLTVECTARDFTIILDEPPWAGRTRMNPLNVFSALSMQMHCC